MDAFRSQQDLSSGQLPRLGAAVEQILQDLAS
jgi:hypothetical protein